MPAAPAAPAATIPSSVQIIDTGPPKPPPPPTTQIRVSQMPAPANPAVAAPKQGKAWDRVRSDLAKKAKPSSFEPPTTAPEPPAASPSAAAPASGTQESSESDSPEQKEGVSSRVEAPSTETAETVAATKADDKGKTGKVSPWKLVDQFKERVTKAEARVLELEKQLTPETDRKMIGDRLTAAEKRSKELEDEIRFVNYQKSEEFQTSYQKPYEDAWKRAMSELSEITIDVEGQKRAVTADDVLQLVNMNLGQARAIADQVFGPFADDVMDHRKEIKRLFDIQGQALKEAKEKGAERDQLRTVQMQQQQSEMAGFIKTQWEKSNADSMAHATYGKYFTPVEGDTEGNQRLSKGYELVDRAFNESPNDPRFTQEQRASVIKRHAAVRHRAAAFGRLVYMNGQLESKLAELQKKLDSINGSVPDAAGREPESATPATSGRAIDRVFGDLRKIAKAV
jgi:hypothetical protein